MTAAYRLAAFASLLFGLSLAVAQDASVPGNFVEVTDQVGVHFEHQAPHTSRKYLIETMGSGAALFDYDNDGRLDLFLVNGAPYGDPTPKGTIPQKTGPKYWNRLYHQKADGTFEDVTEKAGLEGVGYGMGVAVGDYDNDGREDLFVTALGGNKLYHNNGDGTFTDVTAKAGVGGSGWSTSAAWVDLDNDGRLDLVVLRYIQWDWDDVYCGEHREGYRGYCHPDVFQPISMLVYHNNGDGTFTEEAAKLGLDKPAKALGIAIADYDRDGHIDLYVANDSMVEFLFHNKGNGTFEEVGLDSQVAVDGEGRTFAGMGIDFADYNNDGLPDVVVDDLANQKYALFTNAGDGTFNYASYMTGIAGMTLLHSGWGVRFLDYDNDGWKDLLFAQGHDLDTIELTSPQLHYREPLLLARNLGGKKFVDVSSVSGDVFTKRWVGRGMATGDINNDGLEDVVVTENGGPAHVLLNETKTANHWIGFSLVGHKSNRDAIGAVIKITTPQGSQWATVTTASSYLSASDKRVEFGLGREASVQSVEIRWPSGIVQTLKDVKSGQYLKVDEPDK
ncbi:CRTAC1 family protein [Silvibacterium dinghuense]|uniref:CRTAC1 family protein n=1 Tax=Silvibacterium dinghuense TaxID=1560006 RepID=A0A4Q1SHU9_9BACT|nr:CRTAC1 family protein [Silvibacterium dinghuense]RXS97171.1 CRTAC1 family protein [Silvibacterium dinghuense]GGG96800.1 RNA-binding protein [Silvibacterium dinghuense]